MLSASPLTKVDFQLVDGQLEIAGLSSLTEDEAKSVIEYAKANLADILDKLKKDKQPETESAQLDFTPEVAFQKLQDMLEAHRAEGLNLATDGQGGCWPVYPENWTWEQQYQFQKLFLDAKEYIFKPECLASLSAKTSQKRREGQFKCSCCGGHSYWINLAGSKVCVTCHKPAFKTKVYGDGRAKSKLITSGILRAYKTARPEVVQ